MWTQDCVIPTYAFSVGGLMFFIFVVVIKLANDIPVSLAHEIVVVVVVFLVVVINCSILTAGY